MKSVVLLLLAAIQLSAAYNYNSYNRYSQPKPKDVFTYETNFQTALQRAQAEEKPILVISHLTNCRACKELFADLPKNPDTQTVASKYVVVHSLDGSDKQIDNLGPRTDKYFPRCFIYDRNGNMIPAKNAKQPKYPFYFSTANELLKVMNDVINGGRY